MSRMVIYKLFGRIVNGTSVEEIEKLTPLMEITLTDNGWVEISKIDKPIKLGVIQIEQLSEILNHLKLQINELHKPTE